MFFLASVLVLWPSPAPSPVTAWHTPLPDSAVLLGTRADLAYTSSAGGVLAHDVHTGQERWRRDDLRTRSAPAGDLLLGYAPGEQRWHAIDAGTGRTRWTLPGSIGLDLVTTQIARSGGVLFAAAPQVGGPLLGISPETGAVLWQIDAPVRGALEATHGLVLLASTWEVVALDARTGEPRWRHALADEVDCSSLVRLDVSGDEVLFSPDCARPLRLDAIDGHLISALPAQAPAHTLRGDAGGMLLEGDTLTAVTEDGRQRWQAQAPLSLRHGALAGESLWTVSDSHLTQVDLRTGRVQQTGWRAEGHVRLLPTADSDVELIALLPDGSLAGIDTDPAEPASDWTVNGTVSAELMDRLGPAPALRIGGEAVVPDGDGRFSVTVPASGAYEIQAPLADAVGRLCQLSTRWITHGGGEVEVGLTCFEPC